MTIFALYLPLKTKVIPQKPGRFLLVLIASFLESLKNNELVKKKLYELRIDKSLGVNEIHPKLLRESSCVIAKPLAELFQKSLDDGVVPRDWRKGNITSLYKKVLYQRLKIIDQLV